MRKRVIIGQALSSLKSFDKVVLSGGLGEANFMRKMWRGEGDVLLEASSKTTLENLRNTKNLVGDLESVTIITDRTHLPRTWYLARRVFPTSRIGVYGCHVSVWFFISRIFYEALRWIKHAFQ